LKTVPQATLDSKNIPLVECRFVAGRMKASVRLRKFRVGLAKEIERYTSKYHPLSNNIRAVEDVVAALARGKDWRRVVPFSHSPVPN
jgi:hypothetical protein